MMIAGMKLKVSSEYTGTKGDFSNAYIGNSLMLVMLCCYVYHASYMMMPMNASEQAMLIRPMNRMLLKFFQKMRGSMMSHATNSMLDRSERKWVSGTRLAAFWANKCS